METIYVDSLEKLPAAARRVLDLAGESGVVLLYGEMGAGKTTLVRSICDLMGVEDAVSSPTFSLVNHYVSPSGKNIYHFDFYRIENIEEAYDLGYEEYFYGDGLILVEWPEKIDPLIPEEALRVNIRITGPASRQIDIE